MHGISEMAGGIVKPLAIHSRMTEMPLGICCASAMSRKLDGISTPMMSRKTIRSAGSVVEPPADERALAKSGHVTTARIAAMTIAVRNGSMMK